jgi:hypothetical protein
MAQLYHRGDDTAAAMVTSLSPLSDGQEISLVLVLSASSHQRYGRHQYFNCEICQWCQVSTPSWRAAVRFLRLIFLSPYEFMRFIE